MVVKDGMAYLDKSASVCDGGLLAHLLHDFGLCIHFDRVFGGNCVCWWGFRGGVFEVRVV